MEYPQCNREAMRLWVADLRSDTDGQTTGALEVTFPDGSVKRCCLGKGMRTAERCGVNLGEIRYSNMYSGGKKDTQFGEWREAGVLTPAVAEWLGVSHASPIILSGFFDRHGCELHISAVAANDSHGLTFSEIADCIDWYYGLNVPDDQVQSSESES